MSLENIWGKRFPPSYFVLERGFGTQVLGDRGKGGSFSLKEVKGDSPEVGVGLWFDRMSTSLSISGRAGISKLERHTHQLK